ncbi:MAG: penicillin acylase family protein, partial [Pseudomonadota bacterium]
MGSEMRGPVERPREVRAAARTKGKASKKSGPRTVGLTPMAPSGELADAADRPSRPWWPLRALAMVGLTLVAAIALVFVAPQTLAPLNDYQRDGVLTVSGPAAPLTIRRDARGVPYVFAETWADAVFGQGFALGQDRLFQMEMARRLAHGRLAEVTGPRFLPADRMSRTLGLRRLAERRWEALDAAANPPAGFRSRRSAPGRRRRARLWT